jgi:hypothetical protein
MPLKMRLGLGSLGFSGPSISSNAMPIPIPKIFVIGGTGFPAGAGDRLRPAVPNYYSVCHKFFPLGGS